MNEIFTWHVSGQVNDVGGSIVTLLYEFTGTAEQAIAAGWKEDTMPELIDVWCFRVNPQYLDEYDVPEQVIMTNADGDIRAQWRC